MRYRVRMVEFIGTECAPQGIGLTFDDVVLDIADDEKIVAAEASYTARGCGGPDGMRMKMRLWLISPETP